MSFEWSAVECKACGWEGTEEELQDETVQCPDMLCSEYGRLVYVSDNEPVPNQRMDR